MWHRDTPFFALHLANDANWDQQSAETGVQTRRQKLSNNMFVRSDRWGFAMRDIVYGEEIFLGYNYSGECEIGGDADRFSIIDN